MTKAKVLRIVRRGDETVEIRADRKVLATANHDEDGWHGMGRLEDLTHAIGKAFRIEVVES